MAENKVLLVTNSNYPFGGASANYLRLLTSGLSKNDCTVQVLLQRGFFYTDSKEKIKRYNTFENIAYRYVSFTKRPKARILKMLESFLGSVIPVFILINLKIRKKVDTILLYNSTTFEEAGILFISKILRLQIINIVSEWYEKQSLVISPIDNIKWWDFLFRMRYMNFRFDKLIVFSVFLRDYYHDKGYPESKIFLLPNLVDLSPFLPDLFSVTKSNIRIGYCGTPTFEGGILDLMEAFSKVRRKEEKAELLIVGDVADNSQIPYLRSVAEQFYISDSVIFTGLVQYQDIPGLLHSCDILVLARPKGKFAEAGFPTKLGEYFACRKPVVLSLVGDFPLYFQNEKEVIFALPNNPDDLAEKIIYLIENKDVAEKISTNGFDWAKNNLEYITKSASVRNFIIDK
jgi:glycosyltransferase involved in cell wall biosynthesis